MGRPLKIAKAQAFLTLDSITSNVVTVTNDLLNPSDAAYGVTKGMPFIPASNTANLTGNFLVAGSTYWILNITGNSTFTVSNTQLSANPTSTAMTLDNDTDNSVLTVGVTDGYFNDPVSGVGYPATNTSTYGVVGGNTSIYGNQVLANVCIGVTGTGTIYSDTSVAVVSGIGTNFSSSLAVGSWIGTDSSNSLGYVSSIGGAVTVTTASTAAATDRVTVTDSSSLVVNGAVVFAANIGGLTAGTVYYVLAKPSGTTFTVSATPGGTIIQLTDETKVTTATQDTVTLAAVAASSVSNSAYVYATPLAGFIVRQKGKTKYLVQDSNGLVGACYTANVANTALTPNTMTITATYADSSTKKIRSLNDYQSEVFPTTVAASALSVTSPATLYTIYSPGTTDWTALGAASNLSGVTFGALAAGSGTGTAILANANPDVISSFNTALAPTVTAGAFVSGTTYVITSVGDTNWTAIGAPANTAGIAFTATGSGSGTGTATAQGQPNPVVTIGHA